MSYEVLADNIEKPLVDDREYKFIKLSNELKVLLIHDPQTDKSAAGLDVFVGSYKDKDFEIPGLAHFCEHLLFMGTKKYPSENEYASYLSNHGGHSNAFTSFEHTNYYFEVNSGHLEGALDRFAQFFIEPLFDESCKDREINAVDSENKKNLQNDLWRFYQLEKSTSNPKHPYNHFSTGNHVTLGDEPLSKSLNVREILLDFHDKNYSSNLMNLVILGKESLDELTAFAIEKFSSIANKHLPERPDYNNEVVYNEDSLVKCTKAKSIMDTNKMELTFMIPDDQDSNWEYLPAGYYSHLIGHESRGSIYYHLNELGLISSLSCGSTKVCSGSALFVIECELTPKGLENYEDIVVNIFEYLKLIKSLSPQEWLFDEIRKTNEINFRFKQKQNAAQTVSRMSNSLYKFASNIPSKWMFNYTSKTKFNPDVITEFGNFLCLENLRLQVSAKTFSGFTKKEKWYGTSYEYDDIDKKLIQRIQSCSLNENFNLPMKNPFIPENFEILNKNMPNSEPLKSPFLIKDDNQFQVWFKQDDQFNVPNLILHLFLHLPKSNDSIESSIKTQLFCDLLDDELNDISYYASTVGLSLSVNQWRDGILVKLNGYNDKIFTLLKEVLAKIISFQPAVNKFELIKFKLLQDFKNFGYEVPYLQINTNFLTMVNERTYLTNDKIPVLEAINYEALTSFIKEDLFSNVFVESLLVGNLNMEQLNKYVDLIGKSFSDIPKLDTNLNNVHKMIKLQSHTSDVNVIVDLDLDDVENVNSSIDYFVKICKPTDYEQRSLAELISTIFHEPCFNQLRTKEQLGYVVFSGTRILRNYMGYRVLVQSEKSPNYLRSRIENFFSMMKDKLADMTSDEFEKYKKTLIDKKLIKLKNLGEESSKFWNSITDGHFDFKANQKLVDHIETLTQDQLIEFYNKFIEPSTSKAPRFILNLNSHKSKFVALKSIIGSSDSEIIELIERYEDNIEELVGSVTKQKNESSDFKANLLQEIKTKMEEWFPDFSDKRIKFNEFKDFPKAGIPASVEPMSNFHYAESHL
ncbi:metalloprotease [Yamadazyma tenuis]|uniref:LuxS/MPP-like metallohydrolase n=1 Tax=Candida tenuis (strain ATCC 10573 / BCRC 21748 / CBS 615 / JCM 9827 / NBRC 10315 / NRRL Y-1498 / VKM Y-70) TaxID=590646 RepID=G3BAH2_CANTC|nr:uncharacterized protein CANTEDRAFT_99150 [Yamadazyma tenuis ATCC 10573]EGV62059.1 hypothetical protein CANTEDRAFT_99150 [Yamadazyma tenuis ATCC 10573]WEJ93308.1 metalloprotease [Yamadazyma tenuis]